MNNLFDVLITPVILAFLIFISVMTPKLTRKDLYFSIRVPEDLVQREDMKAIYNGYRNMLLLITIPIAIAVTLFFNPETSPMWFVSGIFAIIILHISLFLNARKKVADIKANEDWAIDKKQVTIIDTAVNKKTYMASPMYFGIALLIFVANLIFVVTNYDAFPDQVPTHWNSAGVADAFVEKTMGTILILPLTQLFLIAIMFFAYLSISYTKKQIDVSNPEVSKQRNEIFKNKWSATIIYMLLLIQVMFSILTLNTTSYVNLPSGVFQLLFVFVIGSIFLLVGYNAVTVGQGGSRVKMNEEGKTAEMNRDDDQFWKLGMFYVNKNDPSIFIEKRFGIGFTLNFGNPIAIGLMVALMLLILGFSVLPMIL